MSGEGDWLFRIQDMINIINEIEEHLMNVTKETFLTEIAVQRIAERCFEILGEAARHVPDGMKDKYNEIEWSEITGMRHKIAHDYLYVSPEVIWLTYKTKLAPVKNKLETLLEKEDK